MLSRTTASRLSVLLSLGLILAVVLISVVRPEQRARVAPAALPPSEEPASARADASAMAAEPVVLPPPPAPVSRPRPQTSAAREQPPPKKTQPKPPPVPEATKVDAPPPRKEAPRPSAERNPARRSARQAPERPSRSPGSSPAVEAAATEKPGTSIVASQDDVAEGRTLLRLLEHGAGPTVELAWPEAAGQRETLFALFSRCFGMQVALMDAQDRLYVAEGPSDTPWDLSLDRYSGFIREPAGALSRGERQAVERIRAHHGGLASAAPVRVFPRTVDARLLGGLRRLVGGSYAGAEAIRARYRMNGRRLVVDRIVADGRTIRGRLEIRPVERGACRHLARN
jgi:hypothetical protein